MKKVSLGEERDMTDKELEALYTEYRHHQTKVKGYLTCCSDAEFKEVYRFLEGKLPERIQGVCEKDE